MNNRIKSAIDQYENRKNRKKGVFFASDIYEIFTLSQKDPARIAMTALKAGYIIGYKAGKREKTARRTQIAQ